MLIHALPNSAPRGGGSLEKERRPGGAKALPPLLYGRTKEAALALGSSMALNSNCEKMGLPGYYLYFVVQIGGTNII